jgi:hypothetical protein
MVSTPNAPGQLFELIEREPADTCLYHRIFLDYTYDLGKIYNEKEIAIARTSPSFEREYNLKYLGSIGNLTPYQDVDAAIEEYELPSEGNRRLTTSSKSEIAFFYSFVEKNIIQYFCKCLINPFRLIIFLFFHSLNFWFFSLSFNPCLTT